MCLKPTVLTLQFGFILPGAVNGTYSVSSIALRRRALIFASCSKLYALYSWYNVVHTSNIPLLENKRNITLCYVMIRIIIIIIVIIIIMDYALWPVPIQNYFWNYESVLHFVGLLRRGISPTKGLYLYRITERRKTRRNIHALSGIRTHDPSNQAAKTYAKIRIEW
jgi:hypothetical protein